MKLELLITIRNKMKKIKYIFGILILSLMFLGNACDSETTAAMKQLKIGDKFTYQDASGVDVARTDKDVIVYRLWTMTRYYYFSTTRKDSIIYRIHSNVNNN